MIRNLALTIHITSSAGWFGAVVAFLALAIARSPGVDVLGWYVIVPLCAASFTSGVVQSLVTKWGLFRHYWVAIKLVLTVVASAFLILHVRFVDTAPRAQLVVESSAALVVLAVATALTVFKPRGRIG